MNNHVVEKMLAEKDRYIKKIEKEKEKMEREKAIQPVDVRVTIFRHL